MKFAPGHRMLYGELRVTLPALIRATSGGIATMGCHADPNGVHPVVSPRFENPHDAFVDVDSIRAYLDRAERWQIADRTDGPIEEWTIEKTAGPYTVVQNLEQDRVGLRCDCGWAGKLRAMSRRRLLNGDQAQHRCLVDRPRR